MERCDMCGSVITPEDETVIEDDLLFCSDLCGMHWHEYDYMR